MIQKKKIYIFSHYIGCFSFLPRALEYLVTALPAVELNYIRILLLLFLIHLKLILEELGYKKNSKTRKRWRNISNVDCFAHFPLFDQWTHWELLICQWTYNFLLMPQMYLCWGLSYSTFSHVRLLNEDVLTTALLVNDFLRIHDLLELN